MIRFTIAFVSIVFLFAGCQETVPGSTEPELEMWYDAPAENWNEALPIGNGRLGAMVFGGTSTERIQLNEESVWTRQGSYEDSDGTEAIPKVRSLRVAGNADGTWVAECVVDV